MRVLAGVFLSVMLVLLVLLSTGVIHFRPERFANLFTENGKARVMNVVNMEELWLL